MITSTTAPPRPLANQFDTAKIAIGGTMQLVMICFDANNNPVPIRPAPILRVTNSGSQGIQYGIDGMPQVFNNELATGTATGVLTAFAQASGSEANRRAAVTVYLQQQGLLPA